ncbi:polar amino acid ABC transporter, inner membrane subunit [Alkaliphilus metalliredigens QYMF]|uniref:Polar amino acid ABC transporter, inner membrane subunit n=1 Tax=Alkaliphilus metalliredigens (strain QYMF) TaxID=293826 RepID=A6TMN0_ALKMQ|nr:amino acid ABC transporter permease [Alkaliphilus metalliredigens]ABR47448.1 polar amino acid ABC transporter, inner membrane subunit [Alkaliphilus metalliredigens QYMF]
MTQINFQYDAMIRAFEVVSKSILVTVNMLVVSLVFGFMIGLTVAFIRIYKVRGLYPLTSIYLSAIRGVPLLIQIFIFYFGVPQIFPQTIHFLTPFMSACIAFSINSGAYMSETIRAAILSIDKGQKEAALSVGMTEFKAMKNIVLPQAAVVAIPSLGNTIINLLKETSLAFTIGIADLLGRAKMLSASNYRYLETFVATGLIYWGITILITYVLNKLEKRFSKIYST